MVAAGRCMHGKHHRGQSLDAPRRTRRPAEMPAAFFSPHLRPPDNFWHTCADRNWRMLSDPHTNAHARAALISRKSQHNLRLQDTSLFEESAGTTVAVQVAGASWTRNRPQGPRLIDNVFK